MPYLDWSDEMSTGIVEFDSHHRHLLGLFNRLYDAMKEGRGRDVLADTFAELLEYSRYHFRAEETAMAKVGFAGLDEHRKEHETFTATVEKLIADFHTGKPLVGIETLEFLKNWLFRHILDTDRKYSDALRGGNPE
jgi:hemerythrin-like metal-binding protein